MTIRKKLFIVVLAVAVLAAGFNYARKRPPIVVVGPVELGMGIPGVVDRDTTRRETIAVLGSPLRARETWKQAEARGSSDTIPDYFAGVYAEVYYDNTDRTASIAFDLDDFASHFGTEQRVVVRRQGQSRVLSRKLKLPAAGKPEFWKGLGFTRSQMKVFEDDPRYHNAVYLLDKSGRTLMLLHFSQKDKHLGKVFIGWEP